LTCQTCRRSFEVPPSWARNGRRKFCSKTCKNEAQAGTAGPMRGKTHTPEAKAKMSVALRERHRREPLLAERHPQWKGGRVMAGGYVTLLIRTLSPEDRALAEPMAVQGYVREHRLVAARTLERPLARTEVVHHINGEKADNRPENLAVMDRAPHQQEHRHLAREVAILRAEVARLQSALANCRCT
jgi:hypothetical protein